MTPDQFSAEPERALGERQNNDVWGIVELFGHQRIAGRLSDYSIGGATFLRVDVPPLVAGKDRYGAPVAAVDGHTKLYGGAAIYAIAFVDETAARIAAAEIRHVPINEYAVKNALERMGVATAALSHSDEHFEDEGT